MQNSTYVEGIIAAKEGKSPQFLRTDKAIIEAFCRLLDRKTYEEITVQHILDAVPISRAAFYQHFQDKDAIAEQMLEVYLGLQEKIKSKLKNLPQDGYASAVAEMSEEYSPVIRALMKIHTDRVDLMNAMEQELYTSYKRTIRTREDEVEAHVYAAAMAAFQRTMMYMPQEKMKDQGDPVLFNNVMINVFLKIMKWEDDARLKKLLLDKTRE